MKLNGKALCFSISAACFFSSCSSASKNSSTGAKLQLNVISAGSNAGEVSRIAFPRAQSSSLTVGQTTASSITSLKYFIQSIELCEDMEITGSGYSGASGCISFYKNAESEDVDFYNSYSVSEALNDTNENHFIDFMTDEGRQKLATPVTLTSDMVRTYNYGKIDFMRPIKMTAEFKDANGNTVAYTKRPEPGDIIDGGPDGGGRKIEYVRLRNSTAGPAEELTYMLNNGGTWFAFLKPFEVTQEDIDEGRAITLDFVFNPDGFASAIVLESGCSASGDPAVFDLPNCIAMDLPYAQMAPVPRRSGESTVKEVYLVDYGTGSDTSRLRIELYYNGADPEKSIQGVDVKVLALEGASSLPGNIAQAYRVQEEGGVVSFLGYNSATSAVDATTLSGLKRREEGTLSLYCHFKGGMCAAADGSERVRSYTYGGVATLAAD